MPIKHYFIYLLLALTSNLCLAQADCDQTTYAQAMQTADSLIESGAYNKAYDQYVAAKILCRARSEEVQAAQDSLFSLINGLRAAEEKQRRLAERRQQIADSANQVAQVARKKAEQGAEYAKAQALVFRLDQMPDSYNERKLRLFEETWKRLVKVEADIPPILQQAISKPIYQQKDSNGIRISPLTLPTKGDFPGREFSPDGKRFVVLSNNEANFYDLSGNHLFDLADVSPYSISFEGEYIIAGTQIYNSQGILVHQVPGANKLLISPDQQFIFSTSWNNDYQLWTIKGKLLHSFDGKAAPSLDWKYFVSSTNWETIVLFDLEKNTEKEIKLPSSEAIKWFGFLEKENRILVGYKHKEDRETMVGDVGPSVIVLNLEGKIILDGTVLAEYSANKNASTISSAKEKVLKVSERGGTKKKVRYYLLHTINGNTIELNPEETKEIVDASFSPDGNIVLARMEDRSTKVYNLKGKLVGKIPPQKYPNQPRFSPHGRHLITYNDDSLKLFNFKAEMFFGCPMKTGTYLFSPDEEVVVVRHDVNTFKIYHVNGTDSASFSCPDKTYPYTFYPEWQKTDHLFQEKFK